MMDGRMKKGSHQMEKEMGMKTRTKDQDKKAG